MLFQSLKIASKQTKFSKTQVTLVKSFSTSNTNNSLLTSKKRNKKIKYQESYSNYGYNQN